MDHVLDRADARLPILERDEDYVASERIVTCAAGTADEARVEFEYDYARNVSAEIDKLGCSRFQAPF